MSFGEAAAGFRYFCRASSSFTSSYRRLFYFDTVPDDICGGQRDVYVSGSIGIGRFVTVGVFVNAAGIPFPEVVTGLGSGLLHSGCLLRNVL
jgi:hypothetical protein